MGNKIYVKTGVATAKSVDAIQVENDTELNVTGTVVVGDGTADTELSFTNETGTAVYLGGQSGLNDLTLTGLYTDTDAATFDIEIDGTGSPDTFMWRKNGGTWTTDVDITGSAQLLSDGISATFASTTGHKKKDAWLAGAGYRTRISKETAISAVTSINNKLFVAGSIEALGTLNVNGDMTHSNGDIIITPNENTDSQSVIYRDEGGTEKLRLKWDADSDQLSYEGDARVLFDAGNLAVNSEITAGQDINQIVSEAPIQIGQLIDGTNLEQTFLVTVKGIYAYVYSETSEHIAIVDISDPTTPVHVTNFVPSTVGINQIIVNEGNYLYITSFTDGTLTIIDATEPTSLVEIGVATGMAGANSVATQGDTAFITSFNGDLVYSVDISDPTNPVVITFLSDAIIDGPRDILIIGNYAYITSSAANSFVIIDISDPTNMSVTGGVTDANLFNAYGFCIKGKYAYVPSRNVEAFNVIDISDPTTPVLTTTMTGIDNGWRAIVSGNYVYVSTTTTADIVVVDISDPTNPSIVDSSIPESVDIWGITIVGNYLYAISKGGNSLTVYDLIGITAAHAEIGNIKSDDIVVNNILRARSVYTDDNMSSNNIMTRNLTVTNGAAVTNGNVEIRKGNIQARGKGGIITNFTGGALAGKSLDAGANNTLIGHEAGDALVDDNFNSFYGDGSGKNLTGDRNSGFGAGSLITAGTINRCTGAGMLSGQNSTADDCVYLGYLAGNANSVANKLFIANDNHVLAEGSFADDWLKVHGAIFSSKLNFATSTNTAALGNANIYACTNTDSARTLLISTATIALGSATQTFDFWVKDQSNGAATNAITVTLESGTFEDGSTSQLITADGGDIHIYVDGTNAFTLGA